MLLGLANITSSCRSQGWSY